LSKVIVVKLGTSSITNKGGGLNEKNLQKVVGDVAYLHDQGYKVIMVSSGAVGNGKVFFKNYKGTTLERKAAAAVGNPILINRYSQEFSNFGITIAQTLLERSHFSHRKQFLQLRDTIETLWNNNIIPIANENDVVSDLEIKFSDNDHLATLLAAGFGAEKLIIVSSVEGVLDNEGKTIDVINDSKYVMEHFVSATTSDMGLGGMTTKLHYATLASEMGIETIITGLKSVKPILKSLARKSGTLFPANEFKPKARARWLASGSMANSTIEVDKGAKEAIFDKKSLLAVGIVGFNQKFTKGEIVEIEYKKEKIAVGVTRVDSHEIDIKKKTSNLVVIHVNDLVLI
jgi:glutamate 5-kinase